MQKLSLQDLGWVCVDADDWGDTFRRGETEIYIDYFKRKISVTFRDEDETLSFATLEAIRDLVIERAIY